VYIHRLSTVFDAAGAFGCLRGEAACMLNWPP